MTGPACCDAAFDCETCGRRDCLDTNGATCFTCGTLLCGLCRDGHEGCEAA